MLETILAAKILCLRALEYINKNFYLDISLSIALASLFSCHAILSNVSTGSFDEQSLRTFENELLQVVVPFIEKRYRTIANANQRALAGLSIRLLCALVRNLE